MSNDPVTIPLEGELDLHTFQPRDIPEVVAAFLAAAHPLVAIFYDDTVSRLGATIAVLVAR